MNTPRIGGGAMSPGLGAGAGAVGVGVAS